MLKKKYIEFFSEDDWVNNKAKYSVLQDDAEARACARVCVRARAADALATPNRRRRTRRRRRRRRRKRKRRRKRRRWQARTRPPAWPQAAVARRPFDSKMIRGTALICANSLNSNV
jgi:hypothetical protein